MCSLTQTGRKEVSAAGNWVHTTAKPTQKDRAVHSRDIGGWQFKLGGNLRRLGAAKVAAWLFFMKLQYTSVLSRPNDSPPTDLQREMKADIQKKKKKIRTNA